MSKIFTTEDLQSYMNNAAIWNAAVGSQVVTSVNQWVENYTHRCFGEIKTVTEKYDWSPELWLRHMDVNTDRGPNVASMGIPTFNTPTPSATGDTLPADTYYYVVTAVSDYAQTADDEQTGETRKSNEVTVTTTGNESSVSLSWTPLTGASGYNIYRSTSSGGETLLASLADMTAFTDTGANTPTSQTPPHVSGGMTIKLGYPHLIKSTLDNTSFFWNRWGRVTMYLQNPGEFNPSAVNNDLVEVTYSYGYVDQTLGTNGYQEDGVTSVVPDDLMMAALGIAAGYYNWATNGQKDIVAASVGTYKLQYIGSVRGIAGPGVRPDIEENHDKQNWAIIDSYVMPRT